MEHRPENKRGVWPFLWMGITSWVFLRQQELLTAASNCAEYDLSQPLK